MADSDLGTRIRRARERKRVTGKPMTQQQLADAIGASVRAVGSWERGEAVPRSAIGALEAVLGDLSGEEAVPYEPDTPERGIWDALATAGVTPAGRHSMIRQWQLDNQA